MPSVRPQFFAKAIGVFSNQRIRRAQNMSVGAVILFEFDHMPLRELLLKQTHVLNPRTAKTVNRLVIITHRHHRSFRAGQQFEPSVLQGIGVLKLIHQYVCETLLIMGTQCLIGL